MLWLSYLCQKIVQYSLQDYSVESKNLAIGLNTIINYGIREYVYICLAKLAYQCAFNKGHCHKTLKRSAVTLNACSQAHSQFHSLFIRIMVVLTCFPQMKKKKRQKAKQNFASQTVLKKANFD